MNQRNEEYWWLVGAAWLFGVVALVIVLNVVRVHLLNRSAATPAPVATAPPPAPAVAPIPPASSSPQSIFSETAAGSSPSNAIADAKPQVTDTPTAPVAAATPTEAPKKLHPVVQMEVKDVTDAQIGSALSRGVDFLLKKFGKTARLSAENVDPEIFPGLNALCVYALLHAGQTINDPRLNIQNEHMRDLLDRLKEYPMDGGKATYSRSLRISALAVYNRPEDRAAIAADANWLIKSATKGAYSYTAPPPGGGSGWDNSNSQYGALGMWAAADSGFPIPANYWADVEQHWISCQGPTGGWDYNTGGAGTLSMTSAGVTSLFIARDQQAIESGLGKQQPLSVALTRGLEWLDEGDHAIEQGGHQGYTRYGLERAGLASGYKYFGEHDWYLASAKQAVNSQKEDGSWDGADGVYAETAFNLLLLARGRQPVFMSKLRLADGWGMHPRDVANLTKFAGHELERPLNWQTATLNRDWMDWSDAPVLFIASDKAQSLKDSEVEKLRNFAQGGGLIFTESNANSATFNFFVEELVKKLWPQYSLVDLPEDHVIYSAMYPVLKQQSTGETPVIRKRPTLKGVSNGARLLLVHSPTDLGRQWVLHIAKSQRAAAEMGINIAVYSGGKRNLRNRIDSLYVREPTGKPIGSMGLARVKYSGNWDPEPWAWTRMARKFEWETSIHLDVKETSTEELKFSSEMPLAVMTGTSAFKLSDDEIKALAQFVKAGGTLFLDDCGGKGEFTSSARDMLAKAFPQGALEPLPDEHPILTAKLLGMDPVGKPKYRLFYTEQPPASRPGGVEWIQGDAGQVILSPTDITSGLLGTSTWGILGYDPDWAQQFVKNLLLVAAGVEEKPKKPESTP